MVTKDQIKKEIDNVPDSLLEEVFAWLKKITGKTRRLTWAEWQANLTQFSPDFMDNRSQPANQVRDSLD